MRAIQVTVACVALLFATAGQVLGDIVTYFGDTTGDPTWNRPVGGNPPTPPASGVGTAVPYSVQPFAVTVSGAYDFLSTGTSPTNWDNYAFLYQTVFDPLDQFTNVMIGNDDFPAIGLAGFAGVSLLTGTSYSFVTSGFSNTDFGAFTNTISGPGDITLGLGIPEPSSLALFGVAACAGAARRRRRPRKQDVSLRSASGG